MRKYKKIILGLSIATLALSLSGCSLTSKKATEEEKKEEIKLESYSRNNLELENFYIKNGEEYFKALTGFDCRLENTQIPNKQRNVFLGEDDVLVPTLFNDDKLLLYTSSELPPIYQFERFEDNGYTVGLFNIYRTEVKEEKALGEFGFKNSLDNIIYASNFNQYFGNAEEDTPFILYKINGRKIKEEDLTRGGTFKGLDYGKSYNMEYYQGSQYIKNKIIADTHAFTSIELFESDRVLFDKDSFVEIQLPDNLPNGYYLINGYYFIRKYNGKRKEGIDSSNFSKREETFQKNSKNGIDVYNYYDGKNNIEIYPNGNMYIDGKQITDEKEIEKIKEKIVNEEKKDSKKAEEEEREIEKK